MTKTKLSPKEALMQIGNLLKMEFTKIKKFASAKLVNGTEVMWDGELAEGTAIMVIDADGNQMPAPDAIHELEDGTEIYTTGGLVTKIEPASEEMAATPDMSKMEERMAACEAKMTAMETKMNEMFASMNVKYSAVVESNTNKFAEISKIVEEIASEPIVAVEAPKNSTFSKKAVAMTAIERIAEFKKISNK
jgi:preprotein translocase subunit YajC